MEILPEQRQAALIVSLVGELDALTSNQAYAFVGSKLDGGQQQVFVDLGQVAFMSSAGIGGLLDMLRKSHSMGGDLRLASAQPGVERTLGLSGMVRVLKTYASAREAVGSFGS